MEFTAYASSSKGNLYAITGGTAPLLIECGIPIKEIRQLLPFSLADVAGCIVSHGHKDHSKALPQLLRAGVDVYASGDTFASNSVSYHHRAHAIHGEMFQVGDYRIVSFPTNHDCPGSLGFLVAHGSDRLLFAVDTFYVKHRFAGLTHVCVECNYSAKTIRKDLAPAQAKRLETAHFSLENVLVFLASNDLSSVREIHLLHLSAGNSDEEMFRREVMRATGKPVFVAPERKIANR